MTRPTMFCESCESTVYADDVHSCYDAKAVREQQERERKLAALERAVVKAARRFDAAWDVASVTDEGLGLPPLLRCVPEIRSLCAAVRALDAAEADHP